MDGEFAVALAVEQLAEPLLQVVRGSLVHLSKRHSKLQSVNPLHPRLLDTDRTPHGAPLAQCQPSRRLAGQSTGSPSVNTLLPKACRLSSLFFTQNTQTCPIAFPQGGAHTLPSYAGRCKGYETQPVRRRDSIRHTRVKARGPNGEMLVVRD